MRMMLAPGGASIDWRAIHLYDVAGLWTLRSVHDLELDGLTFFEGPESGAANSRVVDEHVAATLALDEPVTFGVVEPLDLACDAHRSLSCLLFAVLLRRESDLSPLPGRGVQKKTANIAVLTREPASVPAIIAENGSTVKLLSA